MCSGMLKTKAIIEIFQTQFLLFSFIFRMQDRHVVVVREVVDREVAGREVVGSEEEG